MDECFLFSYQFFASGVVIAMVRMQLAAIDLSSVWNSIVSNKRCEGFLEVELIGSECTLES